MPSTKSVFASLALTAILAPAAHAAEVFEYNFQSTYSGPHVLNTQMYQPAVEKLKEQSKGRLVLHYFMSGAISKPEESVPGVINGNIDIGGVVSHYQDTMFPNTHAFEVPHITRDSVQASALYWKAYNEIPEIKAEWDKVGKVLSIWGSDRSGLFSGKGAILTPTDLKGKRVLIWNGGQVDQIKSWGGIPVQVSPNDTYMALQRGMGDVFFGPLPVGVAYKLMEVAKDITVIPATTLFIVNIVNWDVWNELPADLQGMLMAELGGEENSIRSGRLLYDYTNKDIETMRTAGSTIHYLTEAQYQSFKDADREVTTNFWLNDLKRLGVADPTAAIKRAYDMAATVPSVK